MIYLVISLVILLITPFLYHLVEKIGEPFRIVERVLFFLVAALVVIHILPESFEQIGWIAIVVAGIGWALPGLLEKSLHNVAHKIHFVPIVLAVIGIGIHGAMDGLGLSVGTDHLGEGHEGHTHHAVHSLPLAIVLHRVPEALFLWWVLKPKYGYQIPSAVLALIGFTTIFGFWFGHHWLIDFEHGAALGYFQALVGGSLLHLASHRPHTH